MGTIVRDLLPGWVILPTSNFAPPDVIAGTNFPVAGYRFDAATEEGLYFGPIRFHNYGSGNLTLDLEWYADTASAEDIVWGASLAAITPNSDATDIETKAFATENTGSDAHLGTTGQRLHRASVTVSNLDAVAAGDLCWIKLVRKAADGTDDMTGDAILVGATLSYSDT